MKAPWLQQLCDFLTEQNVSFYDQSADENCPADRLYVHLDMDDHKREYTLQIASLGNTAGDHGLAVEADKPRSIQFILMAPFVVDTPHIAETGLYLLMVNRLLPLGAFGLIEDEGFIYFNYSLLTNDASINTALCFEIISAIGFFINATRQITELVACGDISHHEAVQQLEQAGFEFPSVMNE
ncbi:hypothetical protein [Desulfovibrio inopinatus]|uniref:hypothetical protein n=1 Tax=Desulfovibrio inopinatus TaxID=102109 RepID=UPI0003FA39C5|nr:hypothetical protein [Desulfovibrio inopinatus]